MAALSDVDVRTRLADLPGWELHDGALHCAFTTDGWPSTQMLVCAIGYFAEKSDHHPDLDVHWGKVVVTLSTHSAGGVTDKDVSLARTIGQVASWTPGTPLDAR